MEFCQFARQLVQDLWDTKSMYDQHTVNAKKIEKLQGYIKDKVQHIRAFEKRLKKGGGDVRGNSALENLERDLKKASDKLQEWSIRNQSFCTIWNSNKMMQKIEKLRKKVKGFVEDCKSAFDSNVSSIHSMHGPLPPGVRDEVVAVVPAQIASSKREIFDSLCKPMFCANNRQGLWIDHNTGGVCLSMAARGLHITWGDDNRYWNWVPDPNSLFPEVACLKNVCWFEAKGELECSLPPGAYTFTWRMYLGELHGWHSEPAHFTFSMNDDENLECKCYIDPRPHVSRRPVEQFSLPTIRVMGQTGWTEYDVGEFWVEEEQTCVLKFAVDAIQSRAWKSGLFLDGVVVRPTEVLGSYRPRMNPVHTRVSAGRN